MIFVRIKTHIFSGENRLLHLLMEQLLFADPLFLDASVCSWINNSLHGLNGNQFLGNVAILLPKMALVGIRF